MNAPMRNQCPHIEQVLLGVLAQSAGTIPAVQEQRFAHSGMFGPLFGCVLNEGTEDILFKVQQSSDDGDTDAYADMTLRVGGSGVTEITVKAGARVVFAIEAFNLPVAATGSPEGWIKVVSQAATGEPARSMKGVATLAYFTGNLRQRRQSGL